MFMGDLLHLSSATFSRRVRTKPSNSSGHEIHLCLGCRVLHHSLVECGTDFLNCLRPEAIMYGKQPKTFFNETEMGVSLTLPILMVGNSYAKGRLVRLM